MTIKNKVDLILGVIMTGISTYIVWGTNTIKGRTFASTIVPITRADVYMKAIGALLLLVSVIMIIRSISFSQNAVKTPKSLYINKEVYLIVLALIVYCFVIHSIGFIIASFLLLLFILVLLRKKELGASIKDVKTMKNIVIVSLIISILTVAALNYVFVDLLNVYFP